MLIDWSILQQLLGENCFGHGCMIEKLNILMKASVECISVANHSSAAQRWVSSLDNTLCPGGKRNFNKTVERGVQHIFSLQHIVVLTWARCDIITGHDTLGWWVPSLPSSGPVSVSQLQFIPEPVLADTRASHYYHYHYITQIAAHQNMAWDFGFQTRK